MSVVSEVVAKVAPRLPENSTFEDAANIILQVGAEFEELRASKEGKMVPIDELVDIILSEVTTGEYKDDEGIDEEGLLRRRAEAEKAYREGNVKSTTDFEEFWKDINEDGRT